MSTRWHSLLFAVTALAIVEQTGSIAEPVAGRDRAPDGQPEAYAPVTDDPALPRVLLIGDSISIGYTPTVREILRGVANVHRIPENGGSTTRGLQQLDEWLGTEHWEVIHFNFGLHDIKLDEEGRTMTTLEDYQGNLRALIVRMRATGARLIFATTTPVPDPLVDGPRRRATDALSINEAARRVMTELGVPVIDLYGCVRPRLAELQRPGNVHFKPEGDRVLGEQVAAAIRAQLER